MHRYFELNKLLSPELRLHLVWIYVYRKHFRLSRLPYHKDRGDLHVIDVILPLVRFRMRIKLDRLPKLRISIFGEELQCLNFCVPVVRIFMPEQLEFMSRLCDFGITKLYGINILRLVWIRMQRRRAVSLLSLRILVRELHKIRTGLLVVRIFMHFDQPKLPNLRLIDFRHVQQVDQKLLVVRI
jgi:hypothetical protein